MGDLLILAQQNPGVFEPQTNYAGQFFKTLGVLVFVCLLAWIVLRWIATRSVFGTTKLPREVVVLERMILSRQHALYLVKFGDKALLLGCTEQSMVVVAEVPLTQLTHHSKDTHTQHSAPSNLTDQFLDLVAKARAKEKAGTTPAKETIDPSSSKSV